MFDTINDTKREPFMPHSPDKLDRKFFKETMAYAVGLDLVLSAVLKHNFAWVIPETCE